MTAKEIGWVSLAEALELTLLIARKERHRHPSVAARWLRRYLEEHDEATIEEAVLLHPSACGDDAGGVIVPCAVLIQARGGVPGRQPPPP